MVRPGAMRRDEVPAEVAAAIVASLPPQLSSASSTSMDGGCVQPAVSGIQLRSADE